MSNQPHTSTITVFTDGLCEPRNPGGFGCWAWIALDSDGKQLAHDFGCIGHGSGITSNRSEYAAIIFALDHAKTHGWKDIQVCTDSRLVVEQVNGRWACHAPALQALCQDARRLVAVTKARLRWIPREQNRKADALSRTAYAEARRAERRNIASGSNLINNDAAMVATSGAMAQPGKEAMQ